ncbi:hypothetical protein [Streptomyces syringium]|uniref:hypothetical protein n=1 Tax=Streptomyces syringium TaxID=76729 RepID=UPI0034082832
MSDQPSAERGGRLRSHIAWWLGTVSALIGIAAFFLTQCQSTAPSFDDWKTKANAVCEKEVPGIYHEMQGAADSLRALNERLESDPESVTQDDIDATAAEMREIDILTRNLVGSWRELEQPDERKKDLEKLYEAGVATSDASGALAQSIHDNDWKKVDGDATAGEKAQKDWSNQVKNLDLKQCNALFETL